MTASGAPTRVGIVNDVPLVAEALRRIVAAMPDFAIAWIARDGLDAVVRQRADSADVILMDLVMPTMDGVEATRRIMAERPCAILVVTATVSGNLTKVFEALGHGALDAVQTPGFVRGGSDDGTLEFRRKLVSVARLVAPPVDRTRPDRSGPGISPRPAGAAAAASPRPHAASAPSGTSIPPPTSATSASAAALAPAAAPSPVVVPAHEPPLVLIAASTGGPQALATLLDGAGPRLPAAVVVLQHLDARFGDSFLAWLRGRSPLPVRAAVAGERPAKGEVTVAVGEAHLRLDAAGAFTFSAEPDDLPNRPSADVLFESVAERPASHGVAVVLTGMGRDGARGMLALRRAGFHTIAQDDETSVIAGMPRAAVALGGALEVLPIEGIGPRVAAVLRGRAG
ncbi:MAG: chemotaxis-specific protein-glutamate methyltransferase CheB [Chloroflexota bacterium]